MTRHEAIDRNRLGILRRAVAPALWQASKIRPLRRPLAPLGLRIPRWWYPTDLAGRAYVGGESFLMTNLGNELTCRSYWNDDYYEPYSMVLIRELSPELDWFLDVGANVGVFSLFAASAGDIPRIVAFEPNPDVAEILKANVRANDFQIEIRDCALSDETATRRIYFPPSQTSASLEAEFNAVVERESEVHCFRLDELVFEQRVFGRPPEPQRSLVKMDVLGHESAVLRGSQRFIENCRPSLLLEAIKPYDPAEIDFLKSNGYRFHLITRRGLEEVAGMQSRTENGVDFVNLFVSALDGNTVDRLSERVADRASHIDPKRTNLFTGRDA